MLYMQGYWAGFDPWHCPSPPGHKIVSGPPKLSSIWAEEIV